MSAAVPESLLTTDELLRISGFRHDIADHLDAALAAGGGAALRAVTYVATGSEGTDFNVPIGDTLASDEYTVLWAPNGVTDVPVPDLPDSLAGDRTTTQFRVTLASPLTAGDTLVFVILEWA